MANEYTGKTRLEFVSVRFLVSALCFVFRIHTHACLEEVSWVHFVLRATLLEL